MRKVLFVAHNHSSTRPGGMELYAEELYAALRETRRYEPLYVAKVGPPLTPDRAYEGTRFALGDGDLVISKAFTWSGPVAAIAAVGVARSAYEYVLKWAKTYTAGGNLPILHHQAVGYLLAEVAMKIEACRAFSWKAAHYLDQHDSDGHAVGAMAKVFCGETLFTAVFRTMQAMGVNSLDKTHPVEKFLREAAVFPLYDAGNIGMQMRKIWGVMLDPDFDPRAITESRAIPFKKSMEGVGTLVTPPDPPAAETTVAKRGRRR